MSSMAIEMNLDAPYEEALERVEAALKDQGFGVLTRVDVHDAFAEKLGLAFPRYSILGACNPALAHKALSSRSEVGIMLPCNVTVEDDGEGGSVVRIADPEAMMRAGGLQDDPVLLEVGSEAARRLQRVAHSLGGGG